MKLHHLRAAFLVICLLLVCSQGRTTTFTIEFDDESGTVDIGTTTGEFADIRPGPDTITNNYDNEDTFYNALFGTSGQSVQDTNALISDSNNNIDNFDVNLDPSIPEPTTLSLLAMSLLFAGRRWR